MNQDNKSIYLFFCFMLHSYYHLNIIQPLKVQLFLKKNRRICNYLRIKRLFGLHGNWVTRWQPFLFQSSLLFCTNVITLCNKGITFL